MSLVDPSGLAWPAPSSAANDGVRSAIARAAGRTGVDFSYLVAQARMESSLNPNAKAATSSASGLFQFTNGTWLQTLQKHGDLLGGDASTLGALSDPAARAQLLALRSDPEASAMMAAGLASDNSQALSGVLGREPDASELYLAHFLGSDGAGKFLSGLASNPEQSAAALLPKAAAANRGVFFDGSGGARSLGAVMALIRGKMDAALAAEGGAASYAAQMGASTEFAAQAAPEPKGGPIAQEFAQAQTQVSSMAETLQATFGGAGGGAAPDFVRSAYRSFSAFGL